jgi:hypothetical protein
MDSLKYDTASRPQTPVEDFTPTETRLLRETFDSGSKVIGGFQSVVESYIGEPVNIPRLHLSIKEVVQNCVRSSSSERLIVGTNLPNLFLSGTEGYRELARTRRICW